MAGGVYYFEIKGDNKVFLRKVAETRSAIEQTVSVAKASGQDLNGLFTSMEGGLKRLAAGAAAAFTLSKATQFARECINVRSEIQSLEISFETLLQSKEKADRMLGEIRQFAATTPMDMSTLAKGAQTMLSFNIEAEKVMPMLRAIGDISMGDAQKFDSLTLAFSQMSSTGKLMGQDLNQMINAGFNPLAEISIKTGKSIAALKKEMESGNISLKDVTDAFISATGEGGKFHNMLQRQAEGLKGSFAYLKGSISDMMNELGASAEGTVSKSVSLAGDLVKNYKAVGETIGVLVGMYGAYKTAVMVNAALEMSSISRLRNLAKVKQVLIAVQEKLNAKMLMNPYAIAAAAVVGLTYAVYKLATRQSDYEKSLKNLENSTKEYNASVSKENQEIDTLFGRLRNAKKGTEEWDKARTAIWSRYGSYLSKLGDEKTALNDVAAAYDLVRESATKAAKARALDKYLETEDDNYAKDSADNYEKVKQIIIKKKGATFAAIHEKEIRDVVEGRRKVNKNFLAEFDEIISQAGQYGNNQSYADNALAAALGNALRRKEAYDKAVAAGEDKYGIKRSELISGKGGKSEDIDQNSREYWEKEVKNRTESYNKILKSDKEASDKALASLKEAEKELAKYNDYKAESKKKTGLSEAQLIAKEENASGKLADVIRKQEAEKLRIEQDYEFERWQNRIDLMKEGEEKVLSQMELDREKELVALKRRKEQDVEAELQRQMDQFNARENVLAAADKKYAKKTFRDSDINQEEFDKIEERYNKLYEDLGKIQDKSNSDRLDASRASMREFLAEFGNYAEKRKAIEEKYDNDISEGKDYGTRLKLIAEKYKALADLDFKEWQESGDLSMAFGNLENLSAGMIDRLIANMEKYRSKVIATFDPEKIRTYEEALNNLRDAKIDLKYDGADVSDKLRHAISLSQQYADKQSEIAETEAQRKKLQEELNTLLGQTMTPQLGNIAAVGPDGESAQVMEPVSEESIKRINELNVLLKLAEENLRRATGEAEDLKEKTENAGKLRFDDFERVSNGIQTVAERASKLASIFDDDVSEAISDGVEKFSEMYDAIKEITSGVKALTVKTTDTIEQVVDASGKAVSSSAATASASIQALEKASAVLAIIGAAIQLATIVGSLLDPDKKHSKNIEALQERIDALNMSYERLKRTTDSLYSKDRSASIRDQINLLKQQQEMVGRQLAEERGKRKSDKDAIQGYKEKLQDLAFEIEDLKEAAEDAIFGDDIKSQIESFADNYASAWDSNEDRALSARDTVREIMQDMVRESIKAAIQGSAAMEQVRNSLVEFYADGILDQAEQDYIYAIADRLQKQLDVQFGWADSLMSSDSFTQQASSRSSFTMNQETGDELNGRFTALQESNERIAQTLVSMMADSSVIAANMTSILNIGQDILNIHIINSDYLEKISRYCSALSTMRESLSNIERKVKNL